MAQKSQVKFHLLVPKVTKPTSLLSSSENVRVYAECVCTLYGYTSRVVGVSASPLVYLGPGDFGGIYTFFYDHGSDFKELYEFVALETEKYVQLNIGLN
jgi:hypothetical protein